MRALTCTIMLAAVLPLAGCTWTGGSLYTGGVYGRSVSPVTYQTYAVAGGYTKHHHGHDRVYLHVPRHHHKSHVWHHHGWRSHPRHGWHHRHTFRHHSHGWRGHHKGHWPRRHFGHKRSGAGLRLDFRF